MFFSIGVEAMDVTVIVVVVYDDVCDSELGVEVTRDYFPLGDVLDVDSSKDDPCGVDVSVKDASVIEVDVFAGLFLVEY